MLYGGTIDLLVKYRRMSLTTTSKKFKKWSKVVLVVAGIYYVLILVVIPGATEFILNLFVDRNPANPIYGVLDPLSFNGLEYRGIAPRFVLDTKNGRLPAGLPRKMNVYKFKGVQFSYLAGQNAQTDAEKFGFSEAELISNLKDKVYSWRSLLTGGILSINTETRVISLYTDLYGKADQFPKGTLDTEGVKGFIQDQLRNINRLNTEKFKPENMKVTFGVFSGGYLVETRTPSDAQIARIDLYGSVGDYMIYGPNPRKGLISSVLRNPIRGGLQSPLNFPYFDYSSWDIITEDPASYPIINVAEAWKQVSSGNGVLVSVFPKNSNPFDTQPIPLMEKVFINDITLAYYETVDFQKYLQPIWVFTGTYTTVGTQGGDVVYYYPALTAEYTRKITEQ